MYICNIYVACVTYVTYNLRCALYVKICILVFSSNSCIGENKSPNRLSDRHVSVRVTIYFSYVYYYYYYGKFCDIQIVLFG